jgi:predicted small metal-binding protein
MSYTMACGDVVPGCPATFEADTQDELMARVAAHANAAHAEEPTAGCEVADRAVRRHRPDGSVQESLDEDRDE